MFCRGCGYDLRGLSENRCPECSLAFDPADPSTWRSGARSRWVTALISLGLNPVIPIIVLWLAAACELGSLLMPMLLLWLLAQASARRWRSVLLVAVLSPICVFFGRGVVDYCLGKGVLRGPPVCVRIMPATIDRTYRCPIDSHDCSMRAEDRTGFKDYYELGFKLMVRCFGPMPGAYAGPYPTEEQAIACLQQSTRIDPLELANDCPRLPGGLSLPSLHLKDIVFYMVEPDWGSKDKSYLQQLERESGPIRAALFEKGCLVVCIPRRAYGPDKQPDHVIICFDAATGKPFARYFIEGL